MQAVTDGGDGGMARSTPSGILASIEAVAETERPPGVGMLGGTESWDKLRVFHAAAHAGSFTKAGETLDMSQSAVSR